MVVDERKIFTGSTSLQCPPPCPALATSFMPRTLTHMGLFVAAHLPVFRTCCTQAALTMWLVPSGSDPVHGCCTLRSGFCWIYASQQDAELTTGTERVIYHSLLRSCHVSRDGLSPEFLSIHRRIELQMSHVETVWEFYRQYRQWQQQQQQPFLWPLFQDNLDELVEGTSRHLSQHYQGRNHSLSRPHSAGDRRIKGALCLWEKNCSTRHYQRRSLNPYPSSKTRLC